MEGLLSLLLFAGFFYFMMRFGCGAHAVHGHGGHGGHGGGEAREGHGTHGAHDGSGEAAEDPVCGMDVEEGQGYAAIRGEQVLRFCSRRCLDQFEADPGRYLAAEGGAT